jgi:glutaredoxin
MRRVTLYTKPGCGLCDEAKDVIDAVRTRIAFELELCNILEDLGLYEKYKHDIPVILVDGHEIARHHLSEEQLQSSLV